MKIEINDRWDDIVSKLNHPDVLEYDDFDIVITTGRSYEYGYDQVERTIDWDYEYDSDNCWADDAWDFFEGEITKMGIRNQDKLTMEGIVEIFDYDKVYEFLKERYRCVAWEDAQENYHYNLDYAAYD